MSSCPKHPGQSVVGTCSRCGDFVCATDSPVLGGALLCASCRPPVPVDSGLSDLARELVTLAAFVFVWAAFMIAEDLVQPGALLRDDRGGPLMLAGNLVAMTGQAVWIAQDRRRRRRPIERWPVAAFLLGPLAIGLYLALEYRLRSLYLIPLSLCVFFSAPIAAVTFAVVRELLR